MSNYKLLQNAEPNFYSVQANQHVTGLKISPNKFQNIINKCYSVSLVFFHLLNIKVTTSWNFDSASDIKKKGEIR
jgi:hypothetical protein